MDGTIVGITLGGLILTAAGSSFLVKLVNKVIPWEKIGDATEAGAAFLSRWGNMKFSKPFWEPWETLIQEKLAYLLDRANKGFDRDDAEKK